MAQIPDRDERSARWRSRDYAIAAVLGLASMALHAALALDFDATGAFEQQDLFFHADVQSRLDCAVEGRCADRSSVSHPSLALTLSPPIRIAAAIAEMIHGGSLDPFWGRHRAAIFVSPIAVGVQTALVYLFILGVGYGALSAGLVAGLACVTFSGLIFGAIPESFAISAAAIWLAYVLASSPRPAPIWQWGVLGAFATGVTITNIVPIAILHLSSESLAGSPLRRGAARTLGLSLGCVLIALALGLVSSSLYETRELDSDHATRYVTRWMEGNDAVARAARFPTAMLDSIVATAPIKVQNFQAESNDSRYRFRFSLASSPLALSRERALASLILGLVLFGAVVSIRAPGRSRVLALASLMILLFNGVLHAFWGVEHFLYSQHWLPSLLVLTSGGVAIAGTTRRVGCGLLALTIVGVTLQNLSAIRAMMEQLVQS